MRAFNHASYARQTWSSMGPKNWPTIQSMWAIIKYLEDLALIVRLHIPRLGAPLQVPEVVSARSARGRQMREVGRITVELIVDPWASTALGLRNLQ